MAKFSENAKDKKLRSHGKVSRVEQEVLALVLVEFLTASQVASRRKTTVRAAQLTIQSLRRKGLLSPSSFSFASQGGTPRTRSFLGEGHALRLHGEQFVIGIIAGSEAYGNLLRQSNRLEFDGNKVVLHENEVEVYCSKDRSFWGEKVEECVGLSLEYWSSFFRRLEYELKVVLIKPKFRNVRCVKWHFAESNNEIAKQAVKERERIVVRGEDGKVWLLFDDSLKLKEGETVHPIKADLDMRDVVQLTFNSLRKESPEHIREMVGSPRAIAEVLELIKELAKHEVEVAAGLNSVVQLLKPRDDERVEPYSKTIPEYIG